MEVAAFAATLAFQLERGEVIEITKPGRTVARLLPVSQNMSLQDRKALILGLNELAAEMGKHTQTSNVAETISELRR